MAVLANSLWIVLQLINMALSICSSDGFSCLEMQVEKTMTNEKKLKRITRIGDGIFKIYSMHKHFRIAKQT